MHAMLIVTALTCAIPIRPDRPQPAPPPAAPILQVQGRWQMVDYKMAGKNLPQSTIDNISIAIEGNEMRLENRSSKTGPAYDFKFDPTKTPAAFDFRSKTAGKGIGFIGILKVEGDLLTMTFTREGSQRPTQFDGPVDAPQFYQWQLRRIAK